MDGEESKDGSYFGYYAQLVHQQNMLLDHIRTSKYYKAIIGNQDYFKDKVVLDVGCGSGILSFFAAQAGAKRVYAVEAARPMAENARLLIESNGYGDVITVITGKVEDIEDLPGMVDIIISEPMGVLLLHERMIESYLTARDRWLKPDPLTDRFNPAQMFPSQGTIFLAPFSDSCLYAGTHEKIKFWESTNFYGIDLSSLQQAAIDQTFGQAIVGGVDEKTLMSLPVAFEVGFLEDKVEDLYKFSIPLDFSFDMTGVCHGIAGWFDVDFVGPKPVKLSTGPAYERTHWHQVRFVFKNPVAMNRGQRLTGLADFAVNDQRSYNISIHLHIEGLASVGEIQQTYSLHDQLYYNLNQTVDSTPAVSLDYFNLYPSSL